jgi:hypothetical protein
MNTNTVITRQLMPTARTLEAEWRQVLWGSMSQVLGTLGLLNFTMLRPVLAWQAFWNLLTVYFCNFPIFFRPRWTVDNWNHRYWISGYGGTPVSGLALCSHLMFTPIIRPWNPNVVADDQIIVVFNAHSCTYVEQHFPFCLVKGTFNETAYYCFCFEDSYCLQLKTGRILKTMTIQPKSTWCYNPCTVLS